MGHAWKRIFLYVSSRACLCDGGASVISGHKKRCQSSDKMNEGYEIGVKLVKDSERKEKRTGEKEQLCLRFKASSQLACGHSRCGQLPKHLTTQQPLLSSMEPTPTHRHYQTTTPHLFIEAIYI